MSTIELRDQEQARRFLLHGLWLQRVLPVTPASVAPALEWALEVAANGHPLPPVGFVADLGHTAFAPEADARTNREPAAGLGLPAGLARTYEDYVLGRLYADWTFERASDALRHYEGRQRARGLAYLIDRIQDRAGFRGVHFSPAVIKGLQKESPEKLLAAGWESLQRDGLLPLLPELYEALIAATRRTAELLGPEDVFELEHGTALDDLGQRVALRQVLQMADRLQAALPHHRLRPRSGRQEVPTRVLDEDTYPVGGFSSLSTRGSVESLLHSQLAYIEPEQRPDLFDVKFLRDELLYYSRDENQFLRRRRTFVFALFPDLTHARFKDTDLPCQRIVLLLALLVVAVRKLSDWLSTDALLFEFLFVEEKAPGPLTPEQNLLKSVLRDEVSNGTVELHSTPTAAGVAAHCAGRARRSLCHCLSVADSDQPVEAEAVACGRLVLDGRWPALAEGTEVPVRPEVEEALDGWTLALENLLRLWI
jgi:hypothetical protein